MIWLLILSLLIGCYYGRRCDYFLAIGCGLYECLIIKILNGCHRYSSLQWFNRFFVIDFMKIKVLVAIVFNNGNRSCLLFAVKVLYASN